MKAFKCDLCRLYFDAEKGRASMEKEVLDKNHGFVRFKVKYFVTKSDSTTPELCGDCIFNVAQAGLSKGKV